jgi:hypothetical protein
MGVRLDSWKCRRVDPGRQTIGLVRFMRARTALCLSEKMVTYALGRGLTFRDVETVDTLVDRIEHENGRAHALIAGIVESTPFQRRQRPRVANPPNRVVQNPAHPGRRAELRIQR